MIYEKIAVQYGATINIGEYESKKFNLEVVVRLEEGEDKDNAYEQIKQDLTKKGDDWEQELRSNCSKGIKNAVSIEKTIKLAGSTNEYELLICPKCGEEMTQKEGKDYYLCSKHWGYPDMIKKGEVRDKKY